MFSHHFLQHNFTVVCQNKHSWKKAQTRKRRLCYFLRFFQLLKQELVSTPKGDQFPLYVSIIFAQMSEMKIRVEKRTSVFSGYRWISIKSWQQVEARQTESESSSGQMEEKHKNGQKSQGINGIISFS